MKVIGELYFAHLLHGVCAGVFGSTLLHSSFIVLYSVLFLVQMYFFPYF
jgi:hypothetical protein